MFLLDRPLTSEEFTAVLHAAKELGLSEEDLECAVCGVIDAEGVERPLQNWEEIQSRLLAAAGLKP